MKRFAILKILILTMFVSCGAVEDQSDLRAASSAQCKAWRQQSSDFYSKSDFHYGQFQVYHKQSLAKQQECNPIVDFFLLSTCKRAATKLLEQGTYHLKLSNSYSAQGTKLLNQYNENCF